MVGKHLKWRKVGQAMCLLLLVTLLCVELGQYEFALSTQLDFIVLNFYQMGEGVFWGGVKNL